MNSFTDITVSTGRKCFEMDCLQYEIDFFSSPLISSHEIHFFVNCFEIIRLLCNTEICFSNILKKQVYEKKIFFNQQQQKSNKFLKKI